MSFLDDAKSSSKTLGRTPFKMAEIATKLGQKEYKEFIAALKDETITAAAIERALAKRGVKCTGNTVTKFRRALANGNQ